MKKIIKIFCCLVAVLPFCTVGAFEVKVNDEFSSGYAYRSDRISIADNVNQNYSSWDSSARYHNAVHYIENSNSYILGPMWCLDPPLSGPDVDGNDGKIVVKRVLYESKEPLAAAEDYAISTILAKVPEKDFFSNVRDNKDKVEYAAISFALRAFKSAIMQDYKLWPGKSSNNAIVYKYVNTIAHMAKDDATFNELYKKTCENGRKYNKALVCDIQKYTDDLGKKVGASDDRYFTKTFFTSLVDMDYIDKDTGEKKTAKEYFDLEENNTLSKGKEYLKSAMTAFNNSIEGKVDIPTVEINENQIVKGSHSSIVILSISFKNFGSDYSTSYFRFDSFTSSSNKTTAKVLGYNKEVPLSVDDYTPTTETNIYKLAGGNNKIYVVLKVDSNITNENDDDCNIKLDINYRYDDPRLITGAYIECKNDGNANSKFQRFISFNHIVLSSKSIELKQCETVCKPKNSFPENCNDSSKVVNGQVVASFKEGYDTNDKLNIDKCIIGNTDINGNSYEVTSYRENPYCNVYCKEDLDIRMPYKLETYSGRSIDLDVVITGTQSCYTSKIDTAKYRNDLANATGTDRQIIENNYNACLNINVGYNFNPVVNYLYEEKVKPSGEMTLKNAVKCASGATLIAGKCVTDSGTKNYGTDQKMRETTIVARYTTPRIYYISHTNLGLIKVNIEDYEKPYFSVVNGLPIDINTPTGTYNYQIRLENIGTFYGNGSLGRIYGDKNSLAAYREDNGKDIKNKYACTYGVNASSDYCMDEDDNIHTINDKACSGIEDWDTCKQKVCPNESNTSKCIKEKSNYYVCTSDHYDPQKCSKTYGTTKEARKNALKDVGCLDANGNELERCKQNVNCCPQCEIVIVEQCPACIITNGGVTIDYKTISKSNIDPNNNIGYNWNQNVKGPIGIKANYTITEIEQSEEKKFEDSVNGSGVLSDNYSLRVVMTPDMASWIRDYNKDNNSSGSYTNSSLSCTDYEVNKTEASCEDEGYSWIDGKCVIDNLFCYSSFIDRLIAEYPDKVIAPNRSEAKDNNAAFNNYTVDGIDSQKANVQTNGYWTIFPEYVLDNAGPAWK